MDAKRREQLIALIEEWNANRLDLFAISLPDENLEYHGVMRFLFQDEGSKLATKCIRVSSAASTKEVIETLIEKFRPDMKMLTTPIYHLFEVDSNGVERKLNLDEYPLQVQLNWTRDEKEGKFVLRNAAHKPINVNKADKNAESSFKRTKSERKKKDPKKREEDEESDKDPEEPSGVFVRTKSNSEAVMKRRREMKVQKKLDEIQREGDHGGLLKVHGDTLNPDVPYKSLLLCVTDTAAYVVKEMLDKYGLTKANPKEYCLVQIFNAHAGEIGGGLRPQEHVLEDDECPLAILQLQVNKGNITFHVRRRDGKRTAFEDPSGSTPFLVELNLDGSDVMKPKKHMLHTNMTEVGSIAQPSSGQHLRMIGPTILPHHAVIANIEGVVTVTPTSPQAECYVEGKRIHETTVLQHGKVVRFGHHHAFRFFDPKVDETLKKVSGKQGPPSIENGPPGYSPRLDDVLPAGLEFRDEGEDNFLHSVISDVTEGMCQFKLAPCYSLYLACRYRVDRVRPGMSLDEHFHKLMAFCNKVAFMVRDCVNRYRSSPQELSFWMANMSELLHFIKMDKDLRNHTIQAQDILGDTVQESFKDLVYIIQGDLMESMPSFLANTDNDNEAGEVLHVLSSAMSLLRRCRVNAALTIQLFSQLFHFINMWLFNKLVLEPKLGMVNRLWGMRLRRRLNRVEVWAEKQGLELAADCHLARIIQATNLLQTPKHSPDDIAELCTTCYKLNSIQLRFLLEQYQPEPGELLRVPQDVIERAINVARNTADELTRSEHREVTLAEDADLQLPFLLPEDGYSCDIIKGIPQGLADFLEPVMADGLCRLTPLPSQTGSWQTFMMELDEFSQEEDRMSAGPPDHMEPPNPREPEIIQIQLQKVQGSMGLSIVAAKGESQPSKGIYIKSVVPGGAADRDGRLQAGDQLLEVDGKSLIGLSQERAADFMKDTGQVVDLRVAKQGAIYHGLATLLSQPTPPMSRSGQIPPPQDNQTYMTQSKSTSVLSGPDNSFSKPAPQFMSQPDDLRSKSQGNLLRDEEKSKWQPAARGPQPIDPSRAASQPNLDRGDSPNYQNYPDSLVPNQRPVSQYRENIPAPQSPQGNNFPTNRPRSEFVDPNWYPPPPADLPRQPIYQNQVPGKPPHRYDDRDLPPPPDDHLPPPMNNNISPPGSDYVNYQVNGGPARFGNEQAQFQKPSRGDSQSGLPAQSLPSTYDQRQKPAEPPKPAAEPPWARGSGQAQPPRPSVPPTTAAPSVAPSVRPYGQGPRAPQPGDIMRPQPVVQPYRPPQPPADSDGFRQQDSFRGGPRGPPQVEMNKAQPPTNGLPQTAYNQGQPMYPPPNQPGAPQNQPIRGNRPPIPQQMIQNQMVANTNSMWQNDPRRIGDERRELREGAIRELESKPYRSSEEEERLGRLRLDSEFERRADLARTEDSRDSDEDQRNMSYSSSAISNRFQQPASGAIPGGSMGSGPMPGPRGPGSMVGGPMGPGPMSAGPMGAGLMSSGPMGQGPMSAGLMGQGPISGGPMGQGPMSAGPMGPGPMSAGPMGPGPMSGGPMGQQQPPQPRRPGPAMTGPSPPTQPITLPVNNQIDVPAAVKRDILQSKTVTFKPAYREDTMRSRPEVPDSSRTGQVNTQQDFQRQQREPSGPNNYALSMPEREVLRNRLEEELREKQRRESTDGRQSLIRQEEEEMRRRRDYEIMQRKDSERIHMQPMNDVQQRYADQPPMQHRQNAGPVPQRDFMQSDRNSFTQPKPNQNSYERAPDSYRAEYSSNRPSYQTGNYDQQQYQPANQNSFQTPQTPAHNYQSSPVSGYNADPASFHNPNNSRSSLHGQTTPYAEFSSGNTPGVIGAQEVYRDPRSRIEAQQKGFKTRNEVTGDRLSFMEKQRLFAAEAGENSPVQKIKASKSQLALEESLSFGNGVHRTNYNGN